MIDVKRKLLKADGFIEWDFDDLDKKERLPTEFEYLKAKVEALEDIVGTIQLIIRQNKLVYTTEDDASGDIEEKSWRILEDG